MTAREVMTLARSGELLQLSPTIRDNDVTIATFINLALIEIYKRFILKTGEIIITLKDGVSVYKLDGTDTTVVNILGVDIQCVDFGPSSPGAYMYMIGAYGNGADLGDYTVEDVVLPINVEDNLMSINTVSYNEVQVPLITEGATISIIYAAAPTKIDIAAVSSAVTKDAELDKLLDIPDQFTESLLHYMGYRGQGAMDANIQAESNTHYMRFEASCNKLRELGVGITSDDLNMDTRLSKRGFI